MAYVDTLLATNEKIVARHHQHWWAWFPSLVINLLLVAIITALSFVANTFAPGIGIFGLILNVLPLAAFAKRFISWSSEEYIVTNRRIIQTKGLLTKHVFDSSLEKINDVVLSQTVTGRMFNYGDLEILTGSELGLNKLERIQDPVKFKIAMLNAKEGLRDG
jgi:uncharacterized membrane protein YdbT with pleckstrin-like domain